MRVRTVLLTAAGLFLLALGVVGAFLPVLPTTPFVLAGAGCLSGTPKLRRIVQIPFFRDYIESYEKRSGLPRKTVVQSLVFLWGMLLLTMFHSGRLWLILLLMVVGICVTAHILTMAKPRP